MVVTKVVFVQNTSDTVYINLPPANAIIAADAALIAGGTYALPDFEMALFGPPAPIRNGKPVTTSEKLDLTGELYRRLRCGAVRAYIRPSATSRYGSCRQPEHLRR